jgi:FtsH-binding integral membrane protein
MGYAAINGLTMAAIFLAYTQASIASTFFVTAGTFGAMSLYGYTTKRDLSSVGNFAIMALIGLLIASIVNIFLRSTALYWILTYAGVLIFVALTAWDTQKIKRLAAQVGDETSAGRVAVLGALTLYLDFINLFIYLLRILGVRRN